MHKERGAEAAAALKRRGSTSMRFNSTTSAASDTGTWKKKEEAPQQQLYCNGVAVPGSAWNRLPQERQCNNKAQPKRRRSSSYTEAAIGSTRNSTRQGRHRVSNVTSAVDCVWLVPWQQNVRLTWPFYTLTRNSFLRCFHHPAILIPAVGKSTSPSSFSQIFRHLVS